ncbi:PH domain leucine-rich repeat-containing protein phosphatase 2-like isoform X2 [Pecten maximus]|uniref:PH domain leucine-rich repeat-containing protein phosphatase 2-like isoform X2 n=1 Tax=Pecten maximus TaxID=6579 RepID=UPI001458D96B|nr:PH domain leucine-rich repeat-containing protein phosphatase 2-like isoform X2 [Pecten maximus]XP_033753993.1 PH domain leucine-rich repeat-containing protein phosphatase 2-like isoform X2 [Pecten maximus]
MATEAMRSESELELTNVTLDMPRGSDSSLSQVSIGSHASSQGSYASQGTTRGRNEDTQSFSAPYQGAEAWWSVGGFLEQGITHQSVGLSLHKHGEEETWDLSDSLADLYHEVNKRDKESLDQSNEEEEEPDNNNKAYSIDKQWIDQDTSNGFIRVFDSNSESSRLFPSTLSTTAQKICFQCGRPPNSLHIQFNGDIIRRLEPFDCPLALQNEYLQKIGYRDIHKIQEMGSNDSIPWLVKFYAGKPISDSTYSRNQLSAYAMVRKGKLLHQWVRRLCVVSGTRLQIYRDKNKNSKPTVVQLAKGTVEEVQVKGHELCLKLTSTLQGDRSVYLAFADDNTYSKWLRKTKKATAKLPSKADLSNCHLEFLPETVFINEDLSILNLRHNALKERPIEEDIYTIGWLDDLPRFSNLRSLNLADNDLQCFPISVCKMKTLTELNVASNKISEIPSEISDLTNLQMLHAHNNHLTSLPDNMWEMRSLKVVVLAFNHFTTVPEILLESHQTVFHQSLDSVIMAGNRVEKLPHEILSKMRHVKKIDLRMNSLTLLPSETAKFHMLENVTHLDVRDNHIPDLDVRSLKALEYLNCERNAMHTLQINGMSLKNLFASNNELQTFSINPKPEWLVNLEIACNKLKVLPLWVSECFFLVKLDGSHNRLQRLPDKLFVNARKLKILMLGHNCLTELPLEMESTVIEELHLQHNDLADLPQQLLCRASRLRYLNITMNNLEDMPPFPHTDGMNRLQELFMSGNNLGNAALPFACTFPRLKVLHVAHNNITDLHSRDINRLEVLQELNISGNLLRSLPSALCKHPKLQCLRVNANLLKELPDFKKSPNLKILDVGSNRLSELPVSKLMGSQVNLLDISGNPNLMVDSGELKGISNWKKISMVDMRGQNRSLLDLRQAPFDDVNQPWQSGLSQTSGMRNKLSVAIVNKPKFTNEVEGLFGMFDGGRNDEVTKILGDIICDTLLAESKTMTSQKDCMKYTMLAAHTKLRSTGQKVGAAAALCHIKKTTDGASTQHLLNVANVGDTEVVISRSGEAVSLSRLFLIQSDTEESQRICRSDGIITEDGRVSGVTFNTRLLGCSYLYPHILPDPYVTSVNLRQDDQLIIIANNGLWKYMSYQEAVDEIIDIPDPVRAAKRLQDLAQGYGSKESIGVLVVRLLLSDAERLRMKDILEEQYKYEQELLSEIAKRDAARDEERRRRKARKAKEEDAVPMDIYKFREDKRQHRKQVTEVFSMEQGAEESGEYVSLKSMSSDSNSSSVNSTNWESLLQQRLTSEVKDKEIEMVFGDELDADFGPDMDQVDSNWIQPGGKYLGDNAYHLGREIVKPPSPCEGTVLPKYEPFMGPVSRPVSVESIEFQKEYTQPFDIDRDAILFHQMQLARSKSRGASIDSMDSTQSVPVSGSIRQFDPPIKTSSHSIEVLIHRTASLPRKTEFGTSLPEARRSKGQKQRNDCGDEGSDEELEPAVEGRLDERVSLSDGTIRRGSSKKNKPIPSKRLSQEKAQRVEKENLDTNSVKVSKTGQEVYKSLEGNQCISTESVEQVFDFTNSEESVKFPHIEDIGRFSKSEESEGGIAYIEEIVEISDLEQFVMYNNDEDIILVDTFSLSDSEQVDSKEMADLKTDNADVYELPLYLGGSTDSDPAVHVFKAGVSDKPEEDMSVVSGYKGTKKDPKKHHAPAPPKPYLPPRTVPSKFQKNEILIDWKAYKPKKSRKAPSPPLPAHRPSSPPLPERATSPVHRTAPSPPPHEASAPPAKTSKRMPPPRPPLPSDHNSSVSNTNTSVPINGQREKVISTRPPPSLPPHRNTSLVSNGHHTVMAIEDLFAKVDQRKSPPESLKLAQDSNSLTSLKELYEMMEEDDEADANIEGWGQRSTRSVPKQGSQNSKAINVNYKDQVGNNLKQSDLNHQQKMPKTVSWDLLTSSGTQLNKSLSEQSLVITYL